MSAHTPGPWFVYSPVVSRYRLPGIEAVDGRSIVLFGDLESDECGVHGVDEEQRLANANLIAAAPELLAALKRIYLAFAKWECAHRDGALAQAKAAIDKAEGV